MPDYGFFDVSEIRDEVCPYTFPPVNIAETSSGEPSALTSFKEPSST
jgi:hypothetical protein